MPKKMTEKQEQKLFDETVRRIQTGLPQKAERDKMPIEGLAVLLAKFPKNSPEFILVEHELNMRILNIQNRPAYIAIFVTALGFFVVWALSQWHPFESPKTTYVTANCTHQKEYTPTNNQGSTKESQPQQKNLPPIKRVLEIPPTPSASANIKDIQEAQTGKDKKKPINNIKSPK